ncbi:LysR family transcriptional regulator [Mesorhizobium sp. M7A.F.Ca.US.011.01.1.1]|uniref:LysR family transcriptional regulator n=1 Tax=Mesorhizobium sp. M7A.F.Ca.US.011.01.1.1 TaxID=2496741 RepID=UPI000FCB4B32|nr:LysR family transcriptional regulator [Mesorhizobium sp. M7A.F.Ca.US.011.01.1.1]RUX22072.1 LysR family transcriptional regulator [Mesorhizobium sp. M7A.F.Ca.US.011.01.1.1]
MKYHQMEAFYQVMLTGSVTKAASNLGRTQPAVSMTIANLEEELSTTLFDRHAGRISPRKEAEILFEQVRHVMQQMKDIKHHFQQLDAIPVPRISIISSSIVGMDLIPTAVSEIAKSGQELRLMNGTSDTIVSEIENQRHDMAVTDRGAKDVPTASPLFDVEVFKVPVCAVFHRGLIGQGFGPLSAQHLAGHQLCTLYHDNPSALDVRRQLPTPRVEFASFFPMACYAVKNGGVAIADYVTCTAIDALTKGELHSEWRIIADAEPSSYYLMRPTYRARSVMADRCYDAIKAALIRHESP